MKWREAKRSPDGRVEYVQHAESTGSEDRTFAQRVLRGKLQALGGRRPTVVDPGDVITIPAKTWHWWKEVPTKTVAYYAVNTESQ